MRSIQESRHNSHSSGITSFRTLAGGIGASGGKSILIDLEFPRGIFQRKPYGLDVQEDFSLSRALKRDICCVLSNWKEVRNHSNFDDGGVF